MRVAGRLFGGALDRRSCWAARSSRSRAFFWALVYLYRLARDLLDDDEPARARCG